MPRRRKSRLLGDYLLPINDLITVLLVMFLMLVVPQNQAAPKSGLRAIEMGIPTRGELIWTQSELRDRSLFLAVKTDGVYKLSETGYEILTTFTGNRLTNPAPFRAAIAALGRENGVIVAVKPGAMQITQMQLVATLDVVAAAECSVQVVEWTRLEAYRIEHTPQAISGSWQTDVTPQ